MSTRTLAAFAVAAAVLMPFPAAADEPTATLLRVFLTDGTSLVSFGEPARVNDRVIFSMPTDPTPNPPLHLVNLPIGRVDWERTSRYAATARASHYIATQAESDYASLSNDVASTLNEVATTAAPSQRLAIVQRARQTLADWPQNHFNYRAAEVRQMLGLLDEAIADLEASRTPGRFALSLTAFTDPPAIVEPLLPAPTARETVEQVLMAARVVDVSAERTSLLATAVGAIDREKESLPAEWAERARVEAQIQIKQEIALDRSYQSLAARMMLLANRSASQADVRGIERVVQAIHDWDLALGQKRTDAVNSLLRAVEQKLDVARRLQLARDRYALRAPVLAQYRLAIRTPIELFAQLIPALEGVKALSGSPPATLNAIERTVSQILLLTSTIAPPQEVAAAHALLVSAAQLARNAAQIRRDATLASDMTRAWDASSAAAGALMLGARARADIQTLMKPPQPR
jgi:hypothetical protein